MVLKNNQITEKLNKHGFFFQKRISQIIKSELSNIKEEIPVSLYFPDISVKEETAIDILAQNYVKVTDSNNVHIFNLIFECKKNFEKEWVFIKKHIDDTLRIRINAYIYPQHQSSVPPSSFSILKLHNLINHSNSPLEICSEGFELKNNAETSPIMNACKQLIIGLNGIIKERDKYNELMEMYRNNINREYFLCLLITNSPLKVCDFDPNKPNISTGKIDHSDVHYFNRRWLLYSYPMHHHLQIKHFVEIQEEKDYYDLLKLTERTLIFVINSNYLIEFLQLMKQDITVQFSSFKI